MRAYTFRSGTCRKGDENLPHSGCRSHGHRPSEVKRLVLAERKGLETLRLEGIEVVGELMEMARRSRRLLLSKLLS